MSLTTTTLFALLSSDAFATEATINFTSEPEGLLVSSVDIRASGSGGTAVGTSDVCVTPCSVSVEPGVFEFYHASSTYYVKAQKFSVDAGTSNIELVPAARSARNLSGWVAVGGATLATGGLIGAVWATAGDYGAVDISANPPLLASSAGAVALGTTLLAVGVRRLNKQAGTFNASGAARLVVQ